MQVNIFPFERAEEKRSHLRKTFRRQWSGHPFVPIGMGTLQRRPRRVADASRMQVNIFPFERAEEKRSHPEKHFVPTGMGTLQIRRWWCS